MNNVKVVFVELKWCFLSLFGGQKKGEIVLKTSKDYVKELDVLNINEAFVYPDF